MKKILKIVVWTLIGLTLITYHFVSLTEVKREYEIHYNDLKTVYETCTKFRADYVLMADSIFNQRDDSIMYLVRKIDSLESELNR